MPSKFDERRDRSLGRCNALSALFNIRSNFSDLRGKRYLDIKCPKNAVQAILMKAYTLFKIRSVEQPLALPRPAKKECNMNTIEGSVANLYTT